MNTLTENGHGTGAIYQQPEVSRATWEEVGYGVEPANWTIEGMNVSDIQPALNAINNQGQSGSCGGQADEKVGEIYALVAGKPFTRMSAKFTYAPIAYPGGGTTDSALVQQTTTAGWGTEAETPSYQNGNPPTEAFMEDTADITLAAEAVAIKEQAIQAVSVGLDIESIAEAIQKYRAVRIGVVGCNNGTWLSDNPQPPTSQIDASSLWSHFLCAFNFRLSPKDGVTKQIAVLQSWGDGIGDPSAPGVQWLDADYFSTFLPQSPFGSGVWCATAYVWNSSPATKLHYDFKNQLDLGATGEDVIALQQALQIDGEFPAALPCTGYFGAITKAAVGAFQVKHAVTSIGGAGYGRVGPLTLAKLNSLFNV